MRLQPSAGVGNVKVTHSHAKNQASVASIWCGAHIESRYPFRVDSVEKVLSGVGTNFLRTAGALGILGRGGPLSSLFQEFCRGDIFDFFNTIGHLRPSQPFLSAY
jgi:hypothetical protein